jgi:hypothetical protein
MRCYLCGKGVRYTRYALSVTWRGKRTKYFLCSLDCVLLFAKELEAGAQEGEEP